jgi:hypothetical protein
MKVSNLSPKNSAPIGKIGEAAGAMDVIFNQSRFAKIRPFLVCLATAGPFSAYLHRLAGFYI